MSRSLVALGQQNSAAADHRSKSRVRAGLLVTPPQVSLVYSWEGLSDRATIALTGRFCWQSLCVRCDHQRPVVLVGGQDFKKQEALKESAQKL